MTPDRQCKAKPTNRTGLYLMVYFALLLTMGNSIKLLQVKDKLVAISESIDATAPAASGRQQGASTPECQDQGSTTEYAQPIKTNGDALDFGRLAQSVEQRTFNPRPTHTQRHSATKLGGFHRESDAIRAPRCARLHVGRVSGGCQEGDKHVPES